MGQQLLHLPAPLVVTRILLETSIDELPLRIPPACCINKQEGKDGEIGTIQGKGRGSQKVWLVMRKGESSSWVQAAPGNKNNGAIHFQKHLPIREPFPISHSHRCTALQANDRQREMLGDGSVIRKCTSCQAAHTVEPQGCSSV